MFGLGHWEFLIILVLVMIIFGAGRLPEIGAGIGKSIRNFKKGVSDLESEKKVEPEKIEAG
jgi:sec-independent protein translocase protein TatA